MHGLKRNVSKILFTFLLLYVSVCLAADGTNLKGVVTRGDGGITNYIETDTLGNEKYFGSAGVVYGDIYVVDNTTANTFAGIGEANKTQFLQFDTNGVFNNTTPDHTNDHITINVAGDYLINCSITAETSGAGAREISFDIYKNNGATAFVNLHAHRDMIGGGGEIASIVVSGMVTLAVNDTIEVWVHNETNTNNVILSDVSLSMIQVGG